MSLSTPATSIPSLIDATLDELIGGLEAGLFTSVDLVEVKCCLISAARIHSDSSTDISVSDRGGEVDDKSSDGDKPRCCSDCRVT